ncbi:DUF1003 domain-containing protein [Amnibacterium kyonggiense]|uniref:Putative membrane protein n=1 Tax=Amnibacterium kyonggiense TaxID=595671 RepID=A0A4R7FH03_9MICO|nr:DUF1003 domain-containing protein [Amnibacterium kyonggiense]TDS75977.1 putative membrane protein [Amnibacterium kyonggiense]
MAAPGSRRARRDVDPLEAPKGLPRGRRRTSRDVFGRFSESFARGMGTSGFLIGLTAFVIVWLAWNTFLPESAQFDPRATNFTLLTLLLSLQASYAAPLILLAQNRQDDRDRVQVEQDRQRAERNLDDTEYLAREIVALRLLVRDMASQDFVRDELKALLEELDRREVSREAAAAELSAEDAEDRRRREPPSRTTQP